ncbi:hypothetical protein C2R22_10285 [Salinigranum rubrum]|uniref:Uncharacterized protein n=1 Tax=Salinigranum rubrum TaxID=755307 RepID=A0A2I8VJ90_9EURY|nr:hypothetical protein [Salinigranum rubrum]AUV81988.1 hypothetical protein C2R22_10285 [Salinigranum rubrum]
MSESSNSLAREPTRTTTVRSTDTTTPRTGYDADTVAETLLRAFYAQDEREACIRAGDAAGAADAANAARDLMGEAFVAEFPHVPEGQAHLAGVRFVEALFLQDEVENRDEFAAAAADGLDEALFLTDTDPATARCLTTPAGNWSSRTSKRSVSTRASTRRTPAHRPASGNSTASR